MFSTHRLRLLVELHRRGTISEVARALSYSPSTISEQLAQLESEAGADLLEPVGRRVRLTPAGEILVRHAEMILVQVDRAHADLASARAEISGDVRVATFQTAAISLLPELLTEMSQQHPGVTVHLSEIQPDAGTAALMARDFDLVLGEEYPSLPPSPPAPIDRRALLADPMHLYAPGMNIPPGQDSEADLLSYADRPWIMEPGDKPARAWAESLCRRTGFEPDVRFESADLLVHVELAETGHAVALLPDLIWSSRRPKGPLVRLPGDPERKVYTAVRNGAETRPVLMVFRELLEGAARKVSAPDPTRQRA